MVRIKIIGGDFIEHPGTSYFMGEFTLWGWKPGEKKSTRMRLTVKRDVVDLKLKNTDAVPTKAVAAGGALRGALVGSAVGGPVGAVGGLLMGGAASVATANAYNKRACKNQQGFSIVFNDGRKLEGEMNVRMVAGLQNRLLRQRRRAGKSAA